jgi:hypothetical protein
LFDYMPMRVICLSLVSKGGHQLPAKVLPDVRWRARPYSPAGGFLWHGPPKVKALSMVAFV